MRAIAVLASQFATGARVERGNEHDVGRKSGAPPSAGNGYVRVFERLTQRIDHVAVKLGKLIQKEDAAVGKGYLTGPWHHSAANERCVAGGVMWRAEGWFIH